MYLHPRSTVCCRLLLGQPSALSRFAGFRPRLANALCPFLHGLQDGHLALMSPTVAPHPQIDLIQTAAVAAVGPRVGSSSGKLMAAEAMRYSGLRVSLDEARDHGHTAQYVLDVADVEAWKGGAASGIV